MPINLEQAKDKLRLDNDFNDSIIQSLVEAVPNYIESTTGMTIEQQKKEPLATTVGGFLVQLWYYPENTDSYRLRQVIDSLLLTLKDRVIHE